MKKTIVTGITGQDGAYLADWLIKQGYVVFGTYRRHQFGKFLAPGGTGDSGS